MLQLKNISKSYTTGSFTQIALNDVSLDFRKNEFVAILGPSGSGKTTCLNLIGGLDQYDSGDLIINGTSTKHFKDSDWDAYRNNSVGFIFQSYNLISHLSITDNVEMGMTLSGVSAEVKHRKAVEALEKVGLKEHIHKKPGQLSGGQMQRVAIARALANDPDIILADEPTGALDTVTSEQIMELIKEIAKDKLVVMVTHNPELAEAYADRTVQFRDGKVISDSNPPSDIQENTNYQLKKTAMSYFTALKLSGKNISTKKWRTALTAFASSIGIIGIALILSLSNGFDKQISSYESGALSNFPVTINESAASIDLSSRPSEDAGKANKEWTEFTSAGEIYPYDPSANTVMHTNVLSEEYLNYLDGIDSALLDGVSYSRKVSMNILRSDGATAVPVDTASLNFTSYPDKPAGAEGSYLADYYDLLAGSLPEKSTDLVMVVDEYNRMSQSILEALGLDYKAANISFDDIVGREFKLIYNDDYYIESDGMFKLNGNAANLSTMYNNGNAVTLKISGIIRKQQDSPMSTMSAGIAYSDSLAEQFITNAKNSAIVKAQEQQDQVNVLTGKVFSQVNGMGSGMGMGMGFGMSSSGASTDPGSSMSKEDTLAALGAVATPSSISLYPKDFEAKEGIVKYLDQWNEGRSDKEMIVYTDLAEMVTSLSSGIMDGITMVLIAFASISLVVSLIMIGIITYISVLERTKEIGVLRALGARKKDITRVFNAETCIIGSLSGLLGIGIAYLLTIPVNIILKSITDLSNVAQLNPLHAFGLVVLSVGLTMLGGFIPAKFAAKKDPVVALRSE
ncbi:ABC transporter ATP-binding protein/permease [Paenibacillus pedocola]|uniref:ABC transporter ATP-binding protein/permease n=1 Tax=Paenibacillus pedocola TaxID=3242193 RepID=UPI002877DF5D|nr:ABC transporter ATP-binding protein/permease [Paenibacillus typhae]